MSESEWWCPSCEEALPWNRVTYQERCDTCGSPVVESEDKYADAIRERDEAVGLLRSAIDDQEGVGCLFGTTYDEIKGFLAGKEE